MYNKNICKFVPHINMEHITTSNFVYERNVPPVYTMIQSNYHVMYLVVDGTGTVTFDNVEKQVKSGTIFFAFADCKFVIKNTGNLEFMYITFGGHRTDKLFERFGINHSCFSIDGFKELIPLWKNCLGKANENNLDLISESMVLYTFSQMSTMGENPERKLINDILQYVEKNFSDVSLSLESTAKSLGYNEKYISRIFKRSIGITFSEYLKNTRIQHATFLMEQGITSVKNVAFLSGYKDSLYFSNVFKKTVGTAPSEFIKNIKN